MNTATSRSPHDRPRAPRFLPEALAAAQAGRPGQLVRVRLEFPPVLLSVAQLVQYTLMVVWTVAIVGGFVWAGNALFRSP